MKKHFAVFAAFLCVFLQATAGVEESMEKIKSLKLDDFEITQVSLIKKGDALDSKRPERKAYVDFVMVLAQPKKDYPSTMKMMLALPLQEDWNGDFLGRGNGGMGAGMWLQSPSGGGKGFYATAHCNLGTADWAKAKDFKEVVKDFGHRAVYNMTVVGKKITAEFYGKAPKYSFYNGESTGGQEGLSMAERHPEEYNVIAVLYPVTNRTRLHLRFAYEGSLLSGKNYFSDDEIKKISAEIVRQNRGNKGEPIGSKLPYLKYPENAKLDYSKLDFLSAEQIEILKKIHSPVYDKITGEYVTVGQVKSAEFAQNGLSLKKGFPCWMFNWVLGEGRSRKLSDEQYHQYIKDLENLCAADCNAKPNLEKFKALGHKLIILQGKIDTIVPAQYVKEYYDELCKNNAGAAETQKFARLFLLAGGMHGNMNAGILELGKHWFLTGEAPENFNVNVKVLGEKYLQEAELYTPSN